jgi:hypothetical protein
MFVDWDRKPFRQGKSLKVFDLDNVVVDDVWGLEPERPGIYPHSDQKNNEGQFDCMDSWVLGLLIDWFVENGRNHT